MGLKDKFCAKCGKAADSLGDNLCAGCFLAEHPVSVPSKTSIRYCVKCKSVWLGGVWVEMSQPVENYLIQKIVDRIKLPEGIELTKAEIIKTGMQGKIKLILQQGKSASEQEINTQILIEKYCCPECSREKTTKYLAILQLRTDKDVLEFVKRVSRIVSKSGKKQVVKAEECLRGIDFYIASKEVARNIANEIKKKFNCRMSTSTKQHGWDRMKNRPLTKLTILLREK